MELLVHNPDNYQDRFVQISPPPRQEGMSANFIILQYRSHRLNYNEQHKVNNMSIYLKLF